MSKSRVQYCLRSGRILAFALTALTLTGCRPALVRIQVPPADIARANELALEGDAASARNDHYAALIKYIEAARLNPNNTYLDNKLGIAYSQLNFYSQASSAFQHGIALNPKLAFPYNNLGTVHFAQHDLKGAEKYFKRAIDKDPKIAAFHVNLGEVYVERKRMDKAKAEWQKAVSLNAGALQGADSIKVGANRSPTERFYLRARLFATLGDVQHSIENLQMALTAGFTDIELIQSEHDFDRIRQEEPFLAFMKTLALLTKGER